MQVNSKITLEAPQDNKGPLSSSTQGQGESSFSSVLEAKTAAPLRQSSTVNPSHSAKPASASASGHVRAETRGKSQSEVQRSASTPSRTAAATTEKTPPSEASSKGANVDPEPINYGEPSERADKSEKMGLKNEVRLSVNLGDEPAAGDDATPAPDTELLLPTLMATDATAEAGKASDDATTTAVESKDTATKTDDTSAVVSDATAIDFLQHLQNSLATTTQVVIPKTHQLEGSEFISSAEISTTKPSVQKQISDAMSDEGRLDGGNLLPPLAAGRESAASAAVSASKNSELPLSKSGEKDALQLDEPILPVEPDALALPLTEPKLQVSSGLTAADAAHSAGSVKQSGAEAWSGCSATGFQSVAGREHDHSATPGA